jgi:hypothetical protein
LISTASPFLIASAGRFHRRRSVDRFVLERDDMVGQRKVDGLDIGIFQSGGLQQGVQGRGIAHARGIHRELHALEVLELLVAPALDVVLADQNLGAAVARRRGRLVGDDLDLDAACDRIVEPGRGGARAGFDLAGTQRRHHVGGRAKVCHFDIQAFVAEVSLLGGDVDRRVARAAGRADGYRLRARHAGRRNECADENGK